MAVGAGRSTGMCPRSQNELSQCGDERPCGLVAVVEKTFPGAGALESSKDGSPGPLFSSSLLPWKEFGCSASCRRGLPASAWGVGGRGAPGPGARCVGAPGLPEQRTANPAPANSRNAFSHRSGPRGPNSKPWLGWFLLPWGETIPGLSPGFWWQCSMSYRLPAGLWSLPFPICPISSPFSCKDPSQGCKAHPKSRLSSS